MSVSTPPRPWKVPLGAVFLLASLLGGVDTAHGQGAFAGEDGIDVTGEGMAFLELLVDREHPFEGEAFRVVLRCGVEEEFLAKWMIQPFHRPLDVPVRVEAPWIAGLPGASRLEAPEETATGGPTYVLDDDLARGRRGEPERRGEALFRVLEIETRLRPEIPGPLVLSGATMSFAFATAFRDDAFAGRVAVDRHDVYVRAGARVVEVAPLPEEGRPLDFSGAVGRFTVTVGATPTEASVGETVRIAVRIAGEGGLARLTAPPLDLPGLQMRGSTLEREGGETVLRYEVVPRRAGPLEVPAIPFVYFDPQAAEYVTVHTAPLSLTVAAAAVAGVDDIHDLRRVRGAERSVEHGRVPLGWLGGGLLLPWLVAGGVAMRRRRRRANDPAARRARDAVQVFHGRFEAPERDAAEALIAYLAARLGCAPTAVISPRLGTTLERAGIPTATARRAADILDALVGARYGGRHDEAHEAALPGLVEELEGYFRSGEGRR